MQPIAVNDEAMARAEAANYVPLVMTAHGWAAGKPTTPYATVIGRLKREWGGAHMKKHGYVLYLAHPDFEIDCVNGGVFIPTGHPLIKLEDARPVEWSRDGDQHVGRLPGDKEVRITTWNMIAGNDYKIMIGDKMVAATGGDGIKLKDAKKLAEKHLKK